MASESIHFRRNLLVVGIGNPLRGDDAVGLYLLERLKKHYSFRLNCIDIYAPDVVLAENFAKYQHVVIVDAMKGLENKPFKLIPILPSSNKEPLKGIGSHVFKWESILCLAECLYGNYPKTYLLGIGAYDFNFSDTISQACKKNAEEAFQFLVRYCDGRISPSELEKMYLHPEQTSSSAHLIAKSDDLQK